MADDADLFSTKKDLQILSLVPEIHKLLYSQLMILGITKNLKNNFAEEFYSKEFSIYTVTVKISLEFAPDSSITATMVKNLVWHVTIAKLLIIYSTCEDQAALALIPMDVQ